VALLHKHCELLDSIDGDIEAVSADGAYDQRKCDDAAIVNSKILQTETLDTSFRSSFIEGH